MVRRWSWLVLLLVVAMPATGGARQLGPEYFQDLFAAIVRQYLVVPGLDLEVANVVARPAVMEVPDGVLGYRLVSPAKGLEAGRRSLAVVLTVDGRDVGPVRLVGDIGLYRRVVCLKRRLARGTVVGGDDLVMVRKNGALLGENPVVRIEAASGRRLTTSRPAGAVLYESMLEEPPLVHRNDRVTIVADTGRLRITVPGLVRAPGRRGALVPVKNLMSRKVIHARVRDAHTVEVDL